MESRQCRHCHTIYQEPFCPVCGASAEEADRVDESYTIYQPAGSGGHRPSFRPPRKTAAKKERRFFWIVPISLAAVFLTFLVCLAIFLRSGSSKTDTGITEDVLSAPVFSHAAGQFSSPISLSIQNPNGRGTIYYTTDGSVPDDRAAVYTAPFTLGYGTTTVRAVMIDADQKKSAETAAVYTITVPVSGDTANSGSVPANTGGAVIQEAPTADPSMDTSADAPLYTVCIGSFAERKNAEAALSDAEKSGFSAFLTPAQVQGKTMYRVQIGAYRERKNAEAQLKAAQAKGYTDAFIVEK